MGGFLKGAVYGVQKATTSFIFQVNFLACDHLLDVILLWQFPWVLNMEPYTTEGVARRESNTSPQVDTDSESGSVTDLHISASNSSLQSNTSGVSISAPEIQYELVGVIVHSGQANAGHYYSFIKERRFVLEMWS